MNNTTDAKTTFVSHVNTLHQTISDKAVFDKKLINDKFEVEGKYGFFGKLRVVILKIVTLGFYHVKRPHLRVDNVVKKLFESFKTHAPSFKTSAVFKAFADKVADIITKLEDKTNEKYNSAFQTEKEEFLKLVDKTEDQLKKIEASEKDRQKKMNVEKDKIDNKPGFFGNMLNGGINAVKNIGGAIFGDRSGDRKFVPQRKIKLENQGN